MQPMANLLDRQISVHKSIRELFDEHSCYVECRFKSSQVQVKIHLQNGTADMDFLNKSSKLKMPSNPLCTRAFARDVKRALLGRVGDDPEHTAVADALGDDQDLNKSTWCRWWSGESLPNESSAAGIWKRCPGIYEKWFSVTNEDRLQMHLFALDLNWIRVHISPEEAYRYSEALLNAVHKEWGPGFNSRIYIPGPKEREGVNWDDKFNYLAIKLKREKDPKQVIPIGLSKGPISELSQPASFETTRLYQAINPTSLIHYMLRYAVESELPDPGLKQAFIFDLLTAEIAILTMMQVHTPGNLTANGDLLITFLALHEFFWLEDYQTDPCWIDSNPFSRCIEPILTDLIEDFDEKAIWLLFLELREIYFDTLAETTGLKQQDFMAIIGEPI